MDKELFYFGWVATNVISNAYAWSSHKGVGTEAEAQNFYEETYDEYVDNVGVNWFCYPCE
jgi:hypothetical protein